MPFGKYALREVQDYVSLKETGIALLYVVLFIYLINLLLKRRDL